MVSSALWRSRDAGTTFQQGGLDNGFLVNHLVTAPADRSKVRYGRNVVRVQRIDGCTIRIIHFASKNKVVIYVDIYKRRGFDI